MIIYIAGKITAKKEEQLIANINAGVDAGNLVMAKGHNVIVPMLSYYQQQRMELKPDRFWWYQYDFKMIDVCDAIVVISYSEGVRGEIAYAEDKGIKVYYQVEDIPTIKPEPIIPI